MYYLRVNALQMYIYFRHLVLKGVQLFSVPPLGRHLRRLILADGIKYPVGYLHIVRRVLPDYPVYLAGFLNVQAVAKRRACFVRMAPTVVPADLFSVVLC